MPTQTFIKLGLDYIVLEFVGDPTRNRAVIEVGENPDDEMKLFLIEMGKRKH